MLIHSLMAEPQGTELTNDPKVEERWLTKEQFLFLVCILPPLTKLGDFKTEITNLALFISPQHSLNVCQ